MDSEWSRDRRQHQLSPAQPSGHFTMAAKYAFGQGLKELRFLFCQTSEHSAATRYAPPTSPGYDAMRIRGKGIGYGL
jgi:hypothetical protein